MDSTSQRRKSPGRKLIAIIAGLVVIGGMGSVTYVSVAEEEPDALAAAARIPNDQGPDPACAGKPPSPTGSASASPTGSASAKPTGSASASPTASPSASASASASASTSASASPPAEEETLTAPPDVTAQHRNHGRSPGTRDKCHDDQGGPARGDFVDIRSVRPSARGPQRGRNASTGAFVSECGNNANGHHNSDNFIVAPNVTNGAHHVHDYVGNVSADGNSTNDSLAAADTTCARDDRSTYYWPVLRRTDRPGGDQNADGGGKDGNVGTILRPASVRVEFRGNSQAKVRAMPPTIRIITGDAKAVTNGPANAKAQWTCTGFSNRITTKYPLCPRGSQLQRVLDFPSCWDGTNTDSANHRSHIVFPNEEGRCPRRTRPVPQLRLTITYERPNSTNFALDSFPEQLHGPITDHGDFANFMPPALMAFAVECINAGRRC